MVEQSQLNSHRKPGPGSGQNAQWHSHMGTSGQKDHGGKPEQTTPSPDHNSLPTMESVHRHVAAVSPGEDPNTCSEPPPSTGAFAFFFSIEKPYSAEELGTQIRQAVARAGAAAQEGSTQHKAWFKHAATVYEAMVAAVQQLRAPVRQQHSGVVNMAQFWIQALWAPAQKGPGWAGTPSRMRQPAPSIPETSGCRKVKHHRKWGPCRT